jgi:hypothetical protein
MFCIKVVMERGVSVGFHMAWGVRRLYTDGHLELRGGASCGIPEVSTFLYGAWVILR